MIIKLTEAPNYNNAEMNKKILATIKTKIGKEPKYRADLEAAGFTITDDSESVYNNYAVVGPNKNSVCLSKGYDNVPRIYDGFSSVAPKTSAEAFDFVNYLTLDVSARNEYRRAGGIGKTNGETDISLKNGSAIDADFSPKSKTRQYQDMQRRADSARNDVKYYDREIVSTMKKIDDLKKSMDRLKDNRLSSSKRVDDILSEIDDLLKDAGVRTESLITEESEDSAYNNFVKLMQSAEGFKRLSNICDKHGYTLYFATKELRRNGKYRYDITIRPKTGTDYRSEIYIKNNYYTDKLVIEAQTGAYGALASDEYNKFTDAVNHTNELLSELNAFDFSDIYTVEDSDD